MLLLKPFDLCWGLTTIKSILDPTMALQQLALQRLIRLLEPAAFSPKLMFLHHTQSTTLSKIQCRPLYNQDFLMEVNSNLPSRQPFRIESISKLQCKECHQYLKDRQTSKVLLGVPFSIPAILRCLILILKVSISGTIMAHWNSGCWDTCPQAQLKLLRKIRYRRKV